MELSILQSLGKVLLIALVLFLVWLFINRQQKPKQDSWSMIPDKKDLIPLFEHAAELSAQFHGAILSCKFNDVEGLTEAIRALVA